MLRSTLRCALLGCALAKSLPAGNVSGSDSDSIDSGSNSNSGVDMIDTCGANPWDNCRCNCDVAIGPCDCSRPFSPADHSDSDSGSEPAVDTNGRMLSSESDANATSGSDSHSNSGSDSDVENTMDQAEFVAAAARCFYTEERDMAEAIGNGPGYAAEADRLAKLEHNVYDSNNDQVVTAQEWCNWREYASCAYLEGNVLEGTVEGCHALMCFAVDSLHAILGTEICVVDAVANNLEGWKTYIKIEDRMLEDEIAALDAGTADTFEGIVSDNKISTFYAHFNITNWEDYVRWEFAWMDVDNDGCIDDEDEYLRYGLVDDTGKVVDCTDLGLEFTGDTAAEKEAAEAENGGGGDVTERRGRKLVAPHKTMLDKKGKTLDLESSFRMNRVKTCSGHA